LSVDTVVSPLLAYIDSFAASPAPLPPVASDHGWLRMGGREGRMVIVVGLLLVFGALAIWSRSPARENSGRWSTCSSPVIHHGGRWLLVVDLVAASSISSLAAVIRGRQLVFILPLFTVVAEGDQQMRLETSSSLACLFLWIQRRFSLCTPLLLAAIMAMEVVEGRDGGPNPIDWARAHPQR
jgi:hypothetical protein